MCQILLKLDLSSGTLGPYKTVYQLNLCPCELCVLMRRPLTEAVLQHLHRQFC
uniref:Uncharacterized protein n=1 Tax=Arundo donax TaxID=35708 RepID=A0A0A9GWZ5_ARUDO